jgi:membrane protein DedA with SNARE-associated domain
MEQFIQEIVQLIYSLPSTAIYLVFFTIAYVENIIPPIPGDVLVAFGGYLAAESIVGLVPILLLTTVASVIGFMNMYWFGKKWGEHIEVSEKQLWWLRFIPINYLGKVQAWMGRWGIGVVLANRFLAGTRSVISLAAGLSNTRVGLTIIASTISSVLWNGVLLGFGWFVHENWMLVGDYLSIYGRIILGLIVLFFVIRLIIRRYMS